MVSHKVSSSQSVSVKVVNEYSIDGDNLLVSLIRGKTSVCVSFRVGKELPLLMLRWHVNHTEVR